MIQRVLSVTLSAASGSARIGVSPARLAAIAVSDTGAGGTTDLTLTTNPGAGGAKTVWTRSNSNAEIPLTPLVNPSIDEGSAASADAAVYVAGEVILDVAQGTSGDVITVLLLLDERG